MQLNKKLKIGVVLYPTYGGSGVVATELGKELAMKGHEIHFITYSQPVRLDTFQANIFYHEVSVSDYPLFEYQPYETELASKLVDVVKYENLDLLHVHYAIPHASAAFMAKQILAAQGIHIPFITTLHGTDITLVGKDPSFEPVITFCLNVSDAVTAVSQSLKDDTYRFFNTTRNIEVIPNFIDVPEVLPKIDLEIRRKYATDNQRIICHVSNFRKVKRVEDVVLAFHEVSKEIDSVLLMVGDGPERYVAERLCRELGNCGKVVFLGKVRETNEVLKLIDLFMLPSETESFGLAALEAMAFGVPVVSSNTGGIPEVNEHGVSGYLANVGDVAQMAKYAIEILKNEETLQRFKLGAWNKAKNFSLQKILPVYEALYFRVIEGNEFEDLLKEIKK